MTIDFVDTAVEIWYVDGQHQAVFERSPHQGGQYYLKTLEQINEEIAFLLERNGRFSPAFTQGMLEQLQFAQKALQAHGAKPGIVGEGTRRNWQNSLLPPSIEIIESPAAALRLFFPTPQAFQEPSRYSPPAG